MIDKPLGWNLDLLPGGRTLGHSLLFAAVLIPVAYLVAERYDRVEPATAFAAGHVSHLVTDLPLVIVTGAFGEATFLFWPLLEPPDYEQVGGILEGFLRYSTGLSEWLQLGLLAIAALAWYRDGTPGTGYVRPAVDRLHPMRR